MSERKKLLVTGASGVLGYHLCGLAEPDWQVIGAYHHHAIHKPNTYPVDLTHGDTVVELLRQERPDAVIHCAAAAKPDYCQQHPAEAFHINVQASEFLAALCCEQAIPLIFTSTDMVFDGTCAPYVENQPVAATNVYGEQKVLAEERVRQAHPAVTICRMALMFGIHPTRQTFLAQIVDALRAGQEVPLFTDEIRSFLSYSEAARGLLAMLDYPAELVHLGGRESVSRYEFGLMVADAFKLDNQPLVPVKQADISLSAPRPANLTFDTTKLENLGVTFPSLSEQIETIAIDY